MYKRSVPTQRLFLDSATMAPEDFMAYWLLSAACDSDGDMSDSCCRRALAIKEWAWTERVESLVASGLLVRIKADGLTGVRLVNFGKHFASKHRRTSVFMTKADLAIGANIPPAVIPPPSVNSADTPTQDGYTPIPGWRGRQTEEEKEAKFNTWLEQKRVSFARMATEQRP